MTLAHLFAILKGHWLAALLLFCLVAGGIATFTYLSPKQYSAVGSIVLDIKAPDPILGAVLPGIASPSYILTQIDIIRSTRVAKRVVENLKLAESAETRASWLRSTGGNGAFDVWLAHAMLSNLEVRPSRGSNVVNVVYTSADPRFSSAVVNSFIDAFIAISTELRTDPAKEFAKFFDTNSKQLRENLEAAQGKLSKFQQSNGLVVTDERLDVETARLQELSSQSVAMQAMLADSGSRQAQAATQGDKMQEVFGNPMFAALKSDLARQETALEQLTQRLGDAHPQVKEQRAVVAELKGKVETEVRRVASGLGINNTVNQSRVSQVRAAMADQRAKVLKLRATRDEAAVLQRDAENAQRAYDGVLARLNVASLESKGVQSNMSPLAYATPPPVHSSPRVLMNIALGVCLAFVLAVVLALVIEYRDPRLRVNHEVEDVLKQPMLGAIPAFVIGRRSGKPLPRRFRLGGRPLTLSKAKT